MTTHSAGLGHLKNMIVAISKNGVIGDKGNTPWGRSLKDDLQHFQNTTRNKVVIMGRKTAASIIEELGQPLPNRRMVVLSRDKNLRISGCEIYNSPEHIVKIFPRNEIWVIGGAEIYSAFMPFVSRVVVTEINTTIEGDTEFAKIEQLKDVKIWKRRVMSSFSQGKRNAFPFVIVEYTRRPPTLS